MFIGHYAVGLAGTRVAPRAGLRWWFLSVSLVDLLWPVFLLLGWERVEIRPGVTPVTPLDFVSYPITHSLVGCAGWAVALGLVYRAATRDLRGAWWIGAGVLSHWVLDAISHRPDMPLWPGNSPRVGLGLWYSVPATAIVEVAMFVAGLVLYVRATRPKSRAGVVSLWTLVGFLGVAYAANLLGPPPPNVRALAFGALAAWLFPLWGLWIDRTREFRGDGATTVAPKAQLA